MEEERKKTRQAQSQIKIYALYQGIQLLMEKWEMGK